MSAHTPTPWTWINRRADENRAGLLYGDHDIIAEGADGSPLYFSDLDDARFLVLACNHHDELVAALRDLVEQVHEYQLTGSIETDNARAVLAKVEGET